MISHTVLTKGLIQEQHLKFYRLILRMLISGKILVLILQIEQAEADKNIAQAKRKKAVRWRLRKNRK